MALLAGACGSESVDDMVAKAGDPDLSAVERCTAIISLANEGEEGVAPLHELAADPNRRVAACAVRWIAKIDDREAADELVDLLYDDDPVVVVSAATALGRIGEPATAHAIAQVLTSRNRAAVTAALEALGKIGAPEGLPAIERLALRRGATPAADKAGREVRQAAVVTLGQIGDPRARATLVRVLQNDPATAVPAAEALARIFRKNVTPLLPLLEDRRSLPLAFALVDVGQSGTEDALIAALNRYGGVGLAEYYLNCGNRKLENAAEAWAHAHGYSVTTFPSYGGGDRQWGSGP